MVCTANVLSEWKDFPKGLSVLLVDEDTNSAAEIKSKLEAMDYVVSTFCNEDEALSAISRKPESFHVAIVEVNTINSSGRIKFLEAVKDLPTIMTSNDHCLRTMMQCIALGAVEFLRKPLSEDKLRNLWQHVVHKAFNGGGNFLLESLKPVKDSIVSTLQLKVETEEYGDESLELEIACNMSLDQANGSDHSQADDKYPAPSTPQLNQGVRSLDDGDCQDQTNCSTEKETGEQEGETKSVDNTCAADKVVLEEDQPQPHILMDTVVEKEDDFSNGVKIDNNSCPREQDDLNHSNNGALNPSEDLNILKSSRSRAQRKKMKVDWTPDLHKKFVQAVEQLGVDQAIPSKILELMDVQGLTRHNVASHLQKYRMHRRNILPKQDDGRWPRQRDQMQQRSYYPVHNNRPIMAYTPHHSANTYPHGPVYPSWGVPQTWGPPGYHPCTPTENWQWKPYSGMQADAWGCPVMPPPYGLSCALPQPASWFYGLPDKSSSYPQDSLQPAEEVIDRVVKEAISKPWLPLPLGLNSPSTDTVLAELSKQGISTVPSHHHYHHHQRH